MADTKQIICVKWGTKYGPEYVNRLYGMVARNITGPFRLICLTDRKEGLRPEIVALDLPELGCKHPERSFGQWRKSVLWGRELCGLTGTLLFIDLDSIIVDNIDGYFEYGSPDDVIVARNWAKPFKKLGQTSVFRFRVGSHPEILENFRADPQGIADRFGFEQHHVTHCVGDHLKFWPPGWTKHFRLHCLPGFPQRYFVQASIPRGAKIITFPGGPNPDDVALGRWLPQSPAHPTRWQHIRDTWSDRRVEKNRWRHFTRFVLTPDWLRQHWRE